MGFGIGNCPVTFGRMLGRCRRLDHCELLERWGWRLDFRVSERQSTDFHLSYLGFGVGRGSSIVSVTVSWRSGQVALTPQPVAGRMRWEEYVRFVSTLLDAVKRTIHRLSDKGGTKASEEVDEVRAILRQLGEECERKLRETLEGADRGTHPFAGAVGLFLGHHGSYVDNTPRALYELARTLCGTEDARVFALGWSAKARPVRMKARSYDVLTFIVQRSNVVTKGNWRRSERARLYRWVSRELDVEIVGSLGES